MATQTETESAPPIPGSPPDPLTFPDIPPFPTDVPTAPLLRLSWAALLENNPSESQRLFHASRSLGFFYLDLRATPSGAALLHSADALFTLSTDLFALPTPVKLPFDFSAQRSYFGYKPLGAAVVDRAATPDRNEFYNLAKDHLLGLAPPLPAPDLLLRSSPLCTAFVHSAHACLAHLLALLAAHLSLPALPALHRLEQRSGDHLRLLHAPPHDGPSAALGAHSDFGSLTLLFNRVGGLQVQTAEGGWRFVRPLAGHAIVNVGDALALLTGGRVRSCVHRVVAPPGEQRGRAKYSVVYFMRPEDGVVLRDLRGGEGEGRGVTAEEWVLRRALGRRVGGNLDEGWEGTEGG